MPRDRKPTEAAEMAPSRLPHSIYVDERKQLATFEQANYERYEKTILTLSSAFLAFSVSFLGLFKPAASTPPEVRPILGLPVLVLAWLAFAGSVTVMLVCFIVNSLAMRGDIHKLEAAVQDDVAALKALNVFAVLGYVLYFLGGTGFISGLALLILFCALNVGRL
jgi:hypothetical protein